MSSPGPSSGAQSPRKAVSPQATGFSQIQARNLGEGGSSQQMSVLLNWHEKLVELTGTGSIVRVMTDRRTV
jgi:actin related protein 2/3 complex subunit 5